MSAEIIELKTGYRRPSAAGEATGRTLTTTGKNQRLRQERRETWRRADAVTYFWRAYLDFTDQLSRARDAGVKEAHQHPKLSHEDRWEILDRYREALGKQLLTPAPDIATVNWKRHQLSKTFIGTNREWVENVIKNDIAFLAAHPTRKSNRGEVQS